MENRTPRQQSCKDRPSPTTRPVMVLGDGIEPPTRAPSTHRSTAELPERIGADAGNRTRTTRVALSHSALELHPRAGAQGRTRTCEAHRQPIYSRPSLPLEYLCVVGCRGWNRTSCAFRREVMSLASARCLSLRQWRRAKESNHQPVKVGLVFGTSCAPQRATLRLALALPGGIEPPTFGSGNRCALHYATGASSFVGASARTRTSTPALMRGWLCR